MATKTAILFFIYFIIDHYVNGKYLYYPFVFYAVLAKKLNIQFERNITKQKAKAVTMIFSKCLIVVLT